jgi:hypothetical protein
MHRHPVVDFIYGGENAHDIGEPEAARLAQCKRTVLARTP